MKASMNVEVLQILTRMSHKRFETLTAESNAIWVLPRLTCINLSTFLEIHKVQGRIGPFGEKINKTLVSHKLTVRDSELGKGATMLMNRLQQPIVNFRNNLQRQGLEIDTDFRDNFDVSVRFSLVL